MVTSVDIEESLGRIRETFKENYGDDPIKEDTRTVGRMTVDAGKKTVYVTFRGSRNSVFEIVSCLFFWKQKLEESPGNVHAGLYEAFKKVKTSIEPRIAQFLQENAISDIVVEGHSRGSGLATLTALFLQQRYPSLTVKVLTYSTLKIFDAAGAEFYEKTLRDRHWSFICEEDRIPYWIGPEWAGFCSVGKRITFLAEGAPYYTQRVQEERYTYMMKIPVISWLIKMVVPAKYWEAHMPQTYQELAPHALRI